MQYNQIIALTFRTPKSVSNGPTMGGLKSVGKFG